MNTDRRTLRSLRLTPTTAPYIFLIPFLLFFVTLRVGPIVWSLVFCFLQWDGFTPPRFIGLSNFTNLFGSERFWKATFNTFDIIIVYNFFMLLLAVLLAVLITEKSVRFKRFFRTVYFMPVATSLTVCAIIFDRVLATKYGFANLLLQYLGGSGSVPFLTSEEWIKTSIIVMKVWRGTGYYVAYMIAGLMSISPVLYEAAEIDGAGFFRKFSSITFPSLKPIFLFCTIMSVILTFQTFDEPWILNQGGPADSSLTLQILLYQTSFVFNKIGLGSALSYIMTVMMVAVSLLNSYLVQGKGEKS